MNYGEKRMDDIHLLLILEAISFGLTFAFLALGLYTLVQVLSFNSYFGLAIAFLIITAVLHIIRKNY